MIKSTKVCKVLFRKTNRTEYYYEKNFRFVLREEGVISINILVTINTEIVGKLDKITLDAVVYRHKISSNQRVRKIILKKIPPDYLKLFSSSHSSQQPTQRKQTRTFFTFFTPEFKKTSPSFFTQSWMTCK